MVRFFKFLPLLLSLSLAGAGQTASVSNDKPASNEKPGAAALLEKVINKYSQAQYYHIESIVDWEMKGELSRNWTRSFFTAAIAPGNRYRFEARTDYNSALKISDGKTELEYRADDHEYTRQAAPEHGPSPLKAPVYQDQFGMMEATELKKNLVNAIKSVVSPAYLADETVATGGEEIPCYVVRGDFKERGRPAGVKASVTFWIDKQKLAVRKQVLHQEGRLMVNSSQNRVDDQLILFPVAEIEPAAFAGTLFSFQPPADAKLVDAFADPRHPRDLLTGKPAPAVTLQAGNGKELNKVALQDCHGKPVLLDFWATWCEPCVESLGFLSKLHEATASKGLVMLSIDQDEDPATSRDFWTKHAIKWPNFHDEGEVERNFPSSGGIPFFVLIDAGGKIVYSRNGTDEAGLRAAIAKLGPEFAEVDGEAKK